VYVETRLDIEVATSVCARRALFDAVARLCALELLPLEEAARRIRTQACFAAAIDALRRKLRDAV
jgi:hypothetical protein